MDDFINVIKRDPKVQMKIKDVLINCIKLPYKYESKVGYDTLIQNVIPKKLKNLKGATIVDIDIELKMEINGMNYLESRLF